MRPLRISWLRVEIRADLERESRSASASEAARSRNSCSRSALSPYWRRRVWFRISDSIEASANAPHAAWAMWVVCGRRKRNTSGPAIAAGPTAISEGSEAVVKKRQSTDALYRQQQQRLARRPGVVGERGHL